MKRFVVWLSVGVLAFGMVSCGNQGSESDNSGLQTEESSTPDTAPADTSMPETTGPEFVEVPANGNSAVDHDYSLGWTNEMEDLKAVVTDLLGENYFPNMPLDPQMLEDLVGITPNMYEDYLAEIPMISTNVDTLIVVKAARGQVDTVEETLNAYRDKQVDNTMQYPQNLGKIQASKVGRAGDYVIFSLLGGDIMDLLDQGDEAVITHCQEVNDSVIEAISNALR